MKVMSEEMIARLVPGISGGAAQSAQRSRGDQNGFSQLLEKVIQKGSASQDPNIKNENISLLLDLAKIRMNQTVMSALTGDEGEGTGGELDFMYRMHNIQGLQPEASKNRHTDTPQVTVPAHVELDTVIDKAAATYGVDKDLIRSVIRAESNFDANATSPKGAMGLMQLMPATARELGVSNAYDPEQNVMAGARYLKSLLDRYHGDVRLALAAYNWGMGNLERSTGTLPAETRSYVAGIMKNYGKAGV